MVTFGAQIISENADLLSDTIDWLRNTKLFDEIVAIGDLDNGSDILFSAKKADKYALMSISTQEKYLDKLEMLSTTDWRFRIDDDERISSCWEILHPAAPAVVCPGSPRHLRHVP